MRRISFDHEKLNVYQDSLKFAAWGEPVLDRVPPKTAIHGRLDRARTSIRLNIAEGNGRFTAPDRRRFFDTARGSSLECASCLDLLLIKKRRSEDELDVGKERLSRIVSVFVGLIKKTKTPAGLKRSQWSIESGRQSKSRMEITSMRWVG